MKRPRKAKPSASSASERGSDSARLQPERRGKRRFGDRPQAFEPAAQDFDQRLVGRPVTPGICRRRGDLRLEARFGPNARNCGSRSAAIQRSAARSTCRRRDALLARERGEPIVQPGRLRFAVGRESRARPAHRAIRRHWQARARPRRAPARSPPDRAGRCRPRSSGASQRRAITACVRRSSSGASSR